MLCRALFLAVVLSVACSFDGGAGECGNALARRLADGGRFLGQDATTGEILAVGEHRMRLFGGFSLSQRDQCFKAAELSAKRRIIQTMESISSGKRMASLGDGKRQCSSHELFAGQRLVGWAVVEVAETVEGSDFVVAVALSWSPTSERKMREMMSGSLQPAANWKSLVRDFIEPRATFSGSTVFTDERGCPHLLGIGMAQLAGDTQLQRDRAMKWADSFAKKNLILAMNGTTCSLESFAKGRDEKIAAAGSDVELSSDYGSVTDSRDRGAVLEGIGPLAGFSMVHPTTGQKCFVSVWGYEPPVERKVREVRKDDVRKTTCGEGAKVFNPTTGKYEEVNK